MYLHIGENVSLYEKDIVGIFDLEKTTITGETRNFLNNSEMNGTGITISEDMPKSFIIVSNKYKENKIYISPISTSTIEKRCNDGMN